MIIVRGILAVGTITLGFVIYPYYIDYFITPVVAMALALRPDMNILETTYLSLLPLVILLMILFFSVMTLLGKAGISKTEDK